MRCWSLHATGSVDDVVQACLSRLAAEPPKLVLVMASTAQPLEPLLAALKARAPHAVVAGVSTAGEFAAGSGGRAAGTGAAVVFGIAGDDVDVHAGFATGLQKAPEGAVLTALAHLPPASTPRPHRSAIALLDALVGVSEEVTLLLAGHLGPEIPLAGGAAGDDLAMSRPLVGVAGQGTAHDALAVIVLDSTRPVRLGVAHGHEALSEPLEITRSEGAVVSTINNRPAWDAWRDATREAAAGRGINVDTLRGDEVLPFLLQFEAGLDSAQSLMKIRAPLNKDSDGALHFACGIPQGAFVRVTQSDATSQVKSSRRAADAAREGLSDDGAIAGVLVFDCVCRRLILGDRYADAVDEIRAAFPDVPIAGFASYGEVALSPGDWSGFHNTTSVVLVLPGDVNS